MKSNDMESMSIDELWNFHEKVLVQLAEKINFEKARLEGKLRELGNVELADNTFTRLNRKRRPYPPVLPKYQNPNNPSETWSGRGKPPRWLSLLLRAGERLEDFLIVSKSS